jgi:glycosidase
LAFTLLFFFPGVPGIYYGDEVGLEGEKDPDNRRAFPWKESGWDRELRRHIQRLIDLRRQHIALREGELHVLDVQPGETCAALVRVHPEQRMALLINVGQSRTQARLPAAQLGWGSALSCVDELSGMHFSCGGEFAQFDLPPRSALILRPLAD